MHFPRDIYVDVPGHGKDTVNAAYGYGGAPLLVRTLQQLLDVQIDHVAFVGFDGLSQMTDALGGRDVCRREGQHPARPRSGSCANGDSPQRATSAEGAGSWRLSGR